MAPPVYCRRIAFQRFEAQLPKLETTDGLVHASIAVAMHELPELDPWESDAHLRRLADRVLDRVHTESDQARLAHLHDVLFDSERFQGNVSDYYDPLNSYLPAVLNSRLGIPITLTLIYKCVGERSGLRVYGINAPGHFLAGVELASDLMYIDPFYGGKMLAREEAFERIAQATGTSVPASEQFLEKATHRQWLSRILNNLQVIFAHQGRQRDLAAMQELQQLLAEYAD